MSINIIKLRSLFTLLFPVPRKQKMIHKESQNGFRFLFFLFLFFSALFAYFCTILHWFPTLKEAAAQYRAAVKLLSGCREHGARRGVQRCRNLQLHLMLCSLHAVVFLLSMSPTDASDPIRVKDKAIIAATVEGAVTVCA